MLNPEHKKGAESKKKLTEGKSRNGIPDLPPRRNPKGGGIPKSSPAPLHIPPKGFFASDRPEPQ
jgi:hypothetical protein